MAIRYRTTTPLTVVGWQQLVPATPGRKLLVVASGIALAIRPSAAGTATNVVGIPLGGFGDDFIQFTCADYGPALEEPWFAFSAGAGAMLYIYEAINDGKG